MAVASNMRWLKPFAYSDKPPKTPDLTALLTAVSGSLKA